MAARDLADADVETLRRVHAEVDKRMDLMREDRRTLAAEYAALPPSASGIFALFVAFRPDGLPGAFAYLYALTLVPILLIFAMSISGTSDLLAAKTRASIADDIEISSDLSEHDFLPEKKWLEDRIVGFRVAADFNMKLAASYAEHIQRIRRVFGLLVAYLAIVTAAATLAT